MSHKTINYQQIYEEEVSSALLQSLEKPDRFYELSNQDRMLVEELVDIGYKRAISDLLDVELVEDTAALAGEMGTQLYNFANMLQAYLSDSGQNNEEGS